MGGDDENLFRRHLPILRKDIHNASRCIDGTLASHKRSGSMMIYKTGPVVRAAALSVFLAMVFVMAAPLISTPAEGSAGSRHDRAAHPPSAPINEEPQEDYENENIEAALLDRALVIDECTVTWYTAGTCGKRPGDQAYGITASGLPAVDHLTCATDPSVIPMYSDVFVQYADGTIEQLWATDTGVKGNHVDIYIENCDEAIQNGRQILTIWFVPPEGG